jgi:hypothetical protein
MRFENVVGGIVMLSHLFKIKLKIVWDSKQMPHTEVLLSK